MNTEIEYFFRNMIILQKLKLVRSDNNDIIKNKNLKILIFPNNDFFLFSQVSYVIQNILRLKECSMEKT
jgi:hypothetical protein